MLRCQYDLVTKHYHGRNSGPRTTLVTTSGHAEGAYVS